MTKNLPGRRWARHIGILNGPFATAFVLALLGAPGLPIGAIAGALVWRRHRVWGAALGAVIGFGLWLLGWFYFSDRSVNGSRVKSSAKRLPKRENCR